MGQLILVRHGQSAWNLENRFTGWIDVDLTRVGVAEAKSAGSLLSGQHLDAVFTSDLKRAQKTADLMLKEMKISDLRLICSGALNERHYGDLQGLDKDEVRAKYGEEQVHIWRRSFNVPPPGGESLKDTCERVFPYFEEAILPRLKAGHDILVVAHGNSLRALVKKLENLGDDEITEVEIPTGQPWVFQVDSQGQASNRQVLT